MVGSVFYKDGDVLRVVSAGWFKSGGNLLPILGNGAAPPAPPEPTENLWFKMEPRTDSDPLIFGHFFPPYPPRVDSPLPSVDYYARNWLTITGENGTHAAYGGMLRDRPYPKSAAAPSGLVADMAQWIADAKAAGLDGFYTNIMSPYNAANVNWQWMEAMRTACTTYHPDFYIIPMIDVSSGVGNYSATSAQIADEINRFASTSYYLPDSRMLVGTFKMEDRTVANWNGVVSAASANHSLDIALVGVFNNTANIASFSSGIGSAMYAVGAWGPGADPAILGTSSAKSLATAAGKQYQSPWWWQDKRPRLYTWTENRGVEAHRASVNRILLDSPKIVQVCTWSDYSESSQFAPSASMGYGICDLTAYEVTRIRLGGAEPETLVDTVFLSHKARVASTTPVTSPTGAQTSGFMTQRTWASGSAANYDAEVVTFLTAASDVNGVQVTVGGVTTNFTASPGRNTFRVPLAAGGTPPSVVVKRGGVTVCSVASTVTVRATAWQQNQGTFVFGSNRSTFTPFDPTLTNAGATPTYP